MSTNSIDSSYINQQLTSYDANVGFDRENIDTKYKSDNHQPPVDIGRAKEDFLSLLSIESKWHQEISGIKAYGNKVAVEVNPLLNDLRQAANDLKIFSFGLGSNTHIPKLEMFETATVNLATAANDLLINPSQEHIKAFKIATDNLKTATHALKDPIDGSVYLQAISAVDGFVSAIDSAIANSANGNTNEMNAQITSATSNLQSLADIVKDAVKPPLADVSDFNLISNVPLPDDWDLKMDIYHPVRPTGHKVPVVINLVGGGWANADKDHPTMQTMGKEFANNGIAMISPEYRTAPTHTYPAQMQDIDSVLKYVKDHAEENNWDLENITLAGGSAGGHLALQHAMNPRFDDNPDLPNVKNVIAISPSTNLTGDLTKDQYPENDWAVNLVPDFLGTDDMDAKQEASPITYVNQPSDKRFYLFYGEQDTLTTEEAHAQPFISAMDDARQDLDWHSYTDGEHGDWIAPEDEHYDPDFVFRMAQWIKAA